jgi:hypothetical protein
LMRGAQGGVAIRCANAKSPPELVWWAFIRP